MRVILILIFLSGFIYKAHAQLPDLTRLDGKKITEILKNHTARPLPKRETVGDNDWYAVTSNTDFFNSDTITLYSNKMVALKKSCKLFHLEFMETNCNINSEESCNDEITQKHIRSLRYSAYGILARTTFSFMGREYGYVFNIASFNRIVQSSSQWWYEVVLIKKMEY